MATNEDMPWLKRTTALTPLIANCRLAAEAAFDMVPEVREELGRAGLFRLGSPPDDTLPGISLGEFIRVHEELAFADPSVAWASNNSNTAVLWLGRLPSERVADVLAPSTTFVGIALPPVGRAKPHHGKLRVSGRWPVVSGSQDADWFLLHCVIQDDDGTQAPGGLAGAVFLPVPKDAVKVEDTWQGVIALRGSGSNAVSVDSYDVEADRTISIFGNEPLKRDSLALMDARSPFGLFSLQLAAIAAGVGRAALRAAVEQAGKRVSIVNQANWLDWPAVQNTVASAQTAIDSTRVMLFELTTRCTHELEESGTVSDHTRAQVHALADHALRTVRHAVSDLFTVGSIDALRAGHGLEQALRDIHAFGVQWERYRRLHYSAGRVLLGAAPNDPMF